MGSLWVNVYVNLSLASSENIINRKLNKKYRLKIKQKFSEIIFNYLL